MQRVREARKFTVDIPVIGRVTIPRPEQLAFYGALAALAAVEIIDWPIALVLGASHALTQSEHGRVAQEIGEALEDV
ncbi:hypothetical protein MELE44368_07460 [Mycolicibacterium elephantis DSM 44368]|uniref:Uncharacterized protein n=1 Tax=Mycolicibacterium elephantis DSM 44368 TaxID=1335622 RepID=A0A439DN05_9MYCO|nr:hypothetical protein MELE44368_07460 [Mycolicibacterium elephantis DSM 44368]